jgi:hypothetical protein
MSGLAKINQKILGTALMLSTALLVLLFSAQETYALSQSTSERDLVTSNAVISEDGMNLVVPAKLVENEKVDSGDGTSLYSKTYEVDMFLKYNVSAQTYSLSTNRYDSSRAVKSFLTINYKKNSVGHVLLTSVSGHWTNSDSTISVTSALLRYGCGTGVGGNPGVERYVSNYFSYSTGYSSYIPMGGPVASTGANLTLSLKHGTSKWTSFLQCNL